MNQNLEISTKKRNIALYPETFKRLENIKSNLIKERLNPNLTYDEVINSLLDKWG
jgi:hypothetical protein